jgi:hypothetical protein
VRASSRADLVQWFSDRVGPGPNSWTDTLAIFWSRSTRRLADYYLPRPRARQLRRPGLLIATRPSGLPRFYLYLAAALFTIRQLIQRARARYRWDTRPTTKRLK